MRGQTIVALIAVLISGSAAHAQDKVQHVPAQPAANAAASSSAKAKRAGGDGRGCVPVDAIAGAVVLNDKTVELSLKDGSRWRMDFDEACPALGYYQGFYYRRAQAKYLCASHDAVIARSGGECPIAQLSRTKKARKKR